MGLVVKGQGIPTLFLRCWDLGKENYQECFLAGGERTNPAIEKSTFYKPIFLPME